MVRWRILFIVCFGQMRMDTGRTATICYSCISSRLALDERAMPADALLSTPRATDHCDQDRFARHHVDLRHCAGQCVAAAVWDRGTYGSYPPIGYVRGCLSDFVRSNTLGLPAAVGCRRVLLRVLVPSARRSARTDAMVGRDERMVNLCWCNGTFCNGASVRGPSMLLAPIAMIAFLSIRM